MIAEASLPKVLESTAVIRFQDCDPFGHLNNARYIDYFMDARTEQLIDAYEFDLFAVGQKFGSNWVVSKTKIVYLLPAGIREKVIIQTRLILATERKLVVEAIMLDEHNSHMKSVGWAEFTFVSLANGRPASHPDELMQLFNTVRIDGIYEAVTFDERIKQLRIAQRQKRREQADAVTLTVL